jgi:hypothetical protein
LNIYTTSSKYNSHCNYSTHEVFTDFTGRCLVAASNSGCCPCSGFSNYHRSATSSSQLPKLKYITTDSRPVCLGVRSPSEIRDQFFFLLEIFFRQLRVCYFVALSLTRGRICNLQLLLSLASEVPFRSESRRTQDYILLSQFLRLPQPGRLGPRIYILQEQGGPDIPPGTGFPFRRLL